MRLALILCCTICSCALSAAETAGPFAWSARSFDPANPQPSAIARDGTTARAALLAGDGTSGVVQLQTWSGDTEAGGRSVDGTNLFTPPGSNAFIGLRKDWMIREGTDGGSGPWIYYTKFQQDTVTILGFADCTPDALDQSHGAGFALEHALPYDRLLLVLPWRWVQGGGSAYQRGDYRGNPPEAGVFAVPAGMSLSQAQADTATWRLAGLDQILGEIQPHRWSTSFKLEVLGGGRWQVALDIDGDGQRDVVTDSQASGHKPCPFANLDERSGLIISTRAAMGARGGTVGRTATNLTYQLTPATMAGGLHAAFYDFTANLRRLPDISGLEPDVTRIDPVVDYPSTRQPWTGLPNTMVDTFASQHTGSLKITQPGTYTLELRSDDGSRLTLNNAVVINNDGLHGMRRRSTTVDLEAGLHPIAIDFFENRGGAGLVFSWIKPGSTNREVVPAANLVHAQGLEMGPVDRRPFTATIHNVVKSSPTIIDGTAWGTAYDVTAQASTLGMGPVPVARIGTTNQWFIDLPLDPQAPTNITFAQTGSPTPSTITGSIEWAPLDMYHDEAVTIRVGDSVKLQANTFYTESVSIDADGDGSLDYTGNENDVFVHQYTTAGIYTAKAYNQDGDEVGSATITVTEVRLPKAIACEVGFKRQVTIHTGIHDPANLFITTNDPTPAKPSLIQLERGPTVDNHLRIYLKALKRGTPILYVRQGSENGPILAAMEVDEFTLDGSDLNNVVVNGETSLAAGLITMRPYIPDLDVVANMFANTSAFESGDGKTLTTNTDAFNIRTDPATGETIADLRFNFLIPDNENQFCFNVKFWQENQEPVPVGDESKNGKRCRLFVNELVFQYKVPEVKDLVVEVHHKGEAHIDHPLEIASLVAGANLPQVAQGATVNCPGDKGNKDPHVDLLIPVTTTETTEPGKYAVLIEGTAFREKITVEGVNLVIVGISDEDEVSQGGVAFYNDNDTDGNGTKDCDQAGAIANDDLATIRLTALGFEDTEALIFEALAGGSKLRFYRNSDRTGAVTLPYSTTVAETPLTLFVEGAQASTAARDVSLRLKTSADPEADQRHDEGRFTVPRVRITNHPGGVAGPIEFNNTGTQNTARISALPQMPDLRGELTPLPAGYNAQARWQLQCTYESGANRGGHTITGNFPAAQPTSLPITTTWQLRQHSIPTGDTRMRGGDSKVICDVNNSRFSVPCMILGDNPTAANVQSHIAGNAAAEVRTYAWGILQTETTGGVQQFNAGGTRDGEPNYGPGGPQGGWGIGQLDPPPNDDVFFNWQTNATQAYAVMAEKRSHMASYFNALQRTYPAEFEEPPAYTHAGQAVSGRDACAIQLYNGGAELVPLQNRFGTISNYRTCYRFDPTAPSGSRYTFVPNQNSYVNRVLSFMAP